MCSPRPGVGVIECYDPTYRNGFILTEIGARLFFRIGPAETWEPQLGETVAFDRCWSRRRGLWAAKVHPLGASQRLQAAR